MDTENHMPLLLQHKILWSFFKTVQPCHRSQHEQIITNPLQISDNLQILQISDCETQKCH